MAFEPAPAPRPVSIVPFMTAPRRIGPSVEPFGPLSYPSDRSRPADVRLHLIVFYKYRK
jgi:hypothetical protein